MNRDSRSNQLRKYYKVEFLKFLSGIFFVIFLKIVTNSILGRTSLVSSPKTGIGRFYLI